MGNESIKVQSPGRINIIGEHTDYNDGFVLPAAIDKKTIFTLKKNGSNRQKNGSNRQINILAISNNEVCSFDLTKFSPKSEGWFNYVMGVVKEIQNLGGTISGFDAEFIGDVPIGAGMSSSAALECSLAFGLNQLFNLGLSNWQLIRACQMAEHNFVDIKCGIMDQFASVMGKENQVMLLDCRSLEFEYFPFDLKEYQLLLLNSNVSHTLASSKYNTRRAECEEGVAILKKKFPKIKNLRDVSFAMLQQCSSIIPENIFRRCHHVVLENNRVLEAVDALVTSNFQKLGELMYQSHLSLQKDYDVSCPELDYLVQYTFDKNYILGGRMMGGGFGGCTINIIKNEKVNHFIESVSQEYRNHFGHDLTPYTVSIENGASFCAKKVGY